MKDAIPHDLRCAAEVLGSTERGRRTLTGMRRMLDDGADGLDHRGRLALLTLLTGSLGSYAGTVDDLIEQQCPREESRF